MLAKSLRHIHFPYCLKRLDNGHYVALNRNFKPLDIITGEPVTPENMPCSAVVEGLTPSIAAALSHKGSENTDKIYLYEDKAAPMTHREQSEYFQRLSILMSLNITQ